jgi:hypothetical protein
MIVRRLARRAALVITILVPGALGLACPTKDLDIVITKPGVAFLVVACSQDASCAGKKTQLACREQCLWNGTECHGRCQIPGNPAPVSDGFRDLQVLLFSSNPAGLRKSSRCVAVERCTSEDVVGCLARSLNDAVTRSLSQGTELTFDGFLDPSDGFAAVAIYQRPEGSDGTEEPSCAPPRLVSCAGLDVPLDESKLDIQCASCQFGLRTSVGENTRPCPADLFRPKECFLRTCFSAIGGTIVE